MFQKVDKFAAHQDPSVEGRNSGVWGPFGLGAAQIDTDRSVGTCVAEAAGYENCNKAAQ